MSTQEPNPQDPQSHGAPGGASAASMLSPEVQEQLRAGLQQAIPFFVHNDIRISEVGTSYGTAELPDAEHLKNHLGTQHGGALFAVAEAAAGAAYVGAFLEHLGSIRMNAQEAHITYLHWARGPITARSTLKHDPATILAALSEQGNAELSMPCELYDAKHTLVAQMNFRFHLKANRPRSD